MGVLAPWFLGGLLAVGVPIYVHLLRQYKQTPVPFSSLMFFERRTQSSIKHRRLKYLLLFALRCLFVLLLALAFSRPFVSSSTIPKPVSGKTVIIGVDNSFSMRQGDRFARAKQAALSAVNSLASGDRAQVITFGGSAKLLTEMTSDKQLLRGALAGLEVGDDASSYSELARILRSTSETLKRDVEAQVFTDLQKSSLPASFSDLRLDTGTKLEVHSFATDAFPNWTVENVDAPRRVFDTKKVRTVATIAGYNTPETTRKVTLLANGKVLDTKQVKIATGGRATVEFLSLDAPYGLTKCEIRIDAADSFPQDDHWFFSVERADPKPALLVHTAKDVNSPLYIQTALDAATEAAFNIESLTSEQAANVTFSKYAFVILSDAGPMPQKFEDGLEKYVQDGGAALIAVGANGAQGRKLPASGIQLLSVRTTMPGQDRALTVSTIDTSYPSFSGGQSWLGVEFYQTSKLLVPPESGDTRVAARLSDGSPLLVDRRNGNGHVLIFASTFNNVANNLPLQPVWLPFLEQTTHELGGLGSSRASYKVGSYAELRTAKEKAVPVEIAGPKGERMMSLAESAKAQTYQFPSEGFFDIRRANGREEMAAVNVDRRESDFAVVPQETVELWKNTGSTPNPADVARAGAGTSTTGETTELWWWVLLLLAILAVTESVLGNRHLDAAGKEGTA